MESAIDEHLRCPRSLSRRVAGDYRAPYPAWVARADPSMKQVVMHDNLCLIRSGQDWAATE